MPKYEYTGNNDHYLEGGDTVVEPGDVVDLPESTVEPFSGKFRELQTADESDSSGEEDDSLSDEEESAESENEGDSEGDKEDVAEPPFNPSSLSVENLRSELDANDFSDSELDALESAEQSGENRTTALDAIESAR